MFVVFALAIILIGAAIAGQNRTRSAKLWIWGIALWLSVPVGLFLSIIIGLQLAKMGDCHPSAAATITCIVHGYDVSDWVNGLVFSGYAASFLGVPWFGLGLMSIIGASLMRLFRKA